MKTPALLLLAFAVPTSALAAPAAPSHLAAAAVSSTKINVTWRDNATNETGFQLASATNATFANAALHKLPFNTTSFAHSGLGAATTEWYRVRATGNGTSAWSNTVARTTPPSSVTAASSSSTSIIVRWVGNAANASITGYTVRFATSPTFANAQTRTASGAGATSLTVTSLVAFQRYYFSVKANALDAGIYTTAVDAFPYPFGSTLIASRFFGQNAWLPAVIGGVPQGGEFEALLPGPVFDSGVKLIRYGGNTVDNGYDAGASPDEYVEMVQNIRAIGAEPVLQVSKPAGATAAAALVHRVNVTEGLSVKYWEIGNEPERSYATTAAAIAAYFRTFVPLMRAEDPTIEIVGPDLASYDSTIITGLTAPTGPDQICTELDVLTYHVYPFDGTQSRADVLARPEANIATNMQAAKTAAAACNNLRTAAGRPAMRVAIGEMNVEYDFTDSIPEGESAQSFLAGQFWASVMKVAMRNGLLYVAPWSVKEDDPLGYISSSGVKLSTYHHYQMVATTFRGVYLPTVHTVNGAAEPLVVSFAAKDPSQTVVMILNQQETGSLSYTVRLDNTPIVTNSELKVNVPALLAREYTSVLDLPAQASVRLLFDSAGSLILRTVYTLDAAIAEGFPGNANF